ncbi:MAG TPA: hypothetical protein VF331_22980 [Polyangiales bacterium]
MHALEYSVGGKGGTCQGPACAGSGLAAGAGQNTGGYSGEGGGGGGGGGLVVVTSLAAQTIATCSGSSTSCPAAANQANGTACDDNNPRTNNDVCTGGVCKGM